jgi:hypothetical protein
MRYIPRFNNGQWTVFDLEAYGPVSAHLLLDVVEQECARRNGASK